VAIVVEDGTVVSGANSYLSLTTVRAFATARGVTLSLTDATVEVQLVKAVDYIAAREAKFIGERKSASQALTWPRVVGATDLLVPQKIRDAQGFVVMAQALGIEIPPLADPVEPFAVKREKVGPLEQEFAAPEGAATPVWPKIAGADDALGFYYDGIPGLFYRFFGKT